MIEQGSGHTVNMGSLRADAVVGMVEADGRAWVRDLTIVQADYTQSDVGRQSTRYCSITPGAKRLPIPGVTDTVTWPSTISNDSSKKPSGNQS